MKKYSVDCGKFKLELGKKTCIMGILNVTPDSFSDGGRYVDTEFAVSHAMEMVRQGAGIIDIGGESSRPYADPVSIAEEIDRVVPVIRRLSQERLPVPVSVDTVNAEVAAEAIRAGASIINDISALGDPDMAGIAAKTGAPVILMHMKGDPSSMQDAPAYDDVVDEITRFLGDAADKALRAGIARSALMIDPGIGFGKTIGHNLAILRNLSAFKVLDLPILVGASRKSFIRRTLEPFCGQDEEKNREITELGTHAVTCAAVAAGSHIIRVHDVVHTAVAVRMTEAVYGL